MFAITFEELMRLSDEIIQESIIQIDEFDRFYLDSKNRAMFEKARLIVAVSATLGNHEGICRIK